MLRYVIYIPQKYLCKKSGVIIIGQIPFKKIAGYNYNSIINCHVCFFVNAFNTRRAFRQRKKASSGNNQ